VRGGGDALARAALGFVGTRFRLHGRDPATGLDCVGLLAASLAAIGRGAALPTRYALRNSDIASALAFAPAAGLADTSGTIRPGDVVLALSGPLQHHVLIAGPDRTFVHAHAGLRRVVVTPGPLAWPVVRHWRLASD
jgi:hypothetical protein